MRRPSVHAAGRRARLVFDAGAAGIWTVDIDNGTVSLWRGRASDVDSTIYADPWTMVEVLDGRLPGIEAFLGNRLFMRGNIALTMELDDLLPPETRDIRSPRVHRASAMGVRTFYTESGKPDAPPVVLIHGLGATGASFLPMQWELARDHRVFAIDLPGFGESDKPIRRLNPEYFAKWLVCWMDAVGLKTASLVGNSMGGRVALEVGLRSPDRVDKIVLLAPSLAWRRYRAAAAVSVVKILRPELAVMPMRVIHGMAVGVLRTIFAHPERVPTAAMNAAADEFVRHFATRRGRIAFFHAAREIYLEDPHGAKGFWDRLPKLSRPSLWIFGHEDRLIPRGFLRHVKKALPDAQWELWQDCGHVPQFEMPDRTNGRVRAFLRG